jgi:hypothetical protein
MQTLYNSTHNTKFIPTKPNKPNLNHQKNIAVDSPFAFGLLHGNVERFSAIYP